MKLQLTITTTGKEGSINGSIVVNKLMEDNAIDMFEIAAYIGAEKIRSIVMPEWQVEHYVPLYERETRAFMKRKVRGETGTLQTRLLSMGFKPAETDEETQQPSILIAQHDPAINATVITKG